jgi:cytochrome P450
MRTTYDPFAVEEQAPHGVWSELRAHEPVARTASGHWFLARYADVLGATRDVDTFLGGMRAPGVVVADEEKHIAEIPEPRHGRIRRIINAALAPHKVAQAEPFIRELCQNLLEPVVARGRGDLVPEYVDPVPSTVIAHVIGVPREDQAQFKQWSDEVVEGTYATLNRTDRGEGLAGGHPEFAAYIDDQIARRRAATDPPDDLVTRLLTTDVEGERLNDVEIRTQLAFLIIAGNETTRNLIGNLLHAVVADAAVVAALKADGSLVATAVEESLRRDAPVQVLVRNCTRDVDVDGVRLGAGDQVVLGVASANHDEDVYQDADAFRVDRPRLKEHLAFGAGPHICPGASLARLEARVALEVFVARIASAELEPGYTFTKVPVFWANGPRSLPVRLEPASPN